MNASTSNLKIQNNGLVRIAVVGAGHLGKFHSRLAAANPAFDLVAVADPCEAACQSLADETSSRAVADYHDLIGHIDAAVVATPTVTHHKIVKELLEQGIHVLVEKPIAPTLAEADDLVETAEANGCILQVGHVERFNPVLGLVESDLRDPRFIQATRTSGYTFRSTDIGAVLDIMIHDIDLVLSIAKSPVASVSAMGVSVLGDHEDMVTAQLTFESGCVAQLTASRVSYEMQRTMQVYTMRGFAKLDFNTRTATTIHPREDVLRREFHVDSLTAEQKDHLKANLFEELLVKTTSEAPAVNAIDEEQQDFVIAIRTGSQPRVSGAVGRDALAVAEAILAQVADHAWDGNDQGRHGMFPTPAMPVLPAAHRWPAEMPQRKAG